MKVPQHLIDEATRRGIVEGAVVKTATGNHYTERVEHPSAWTHATNGVIWNDGSHGICLYDEHSSRWATVITPAPSQGLEEGMATECSPAMRAAIIERARELGLPTYDTVLSSSIVAFRKGQVWAAKKGSTVDAEATIRIASHEFLARLEATAKKLPKRETINGHDVTFHKGSVYLPCSQYTNETVRAIAANLKD